MPRIVHFEFHSDAPQQTIDFFKGVFGWEFKHWGEGGGDYWLVSTGESKAPGIDGGLMKSDDGQPRTVNTVEVDDVDAYVSKVEQHGGKVAIPKFAIPTVGWISYVTDPRGVLFGIYKHDESAK